MRRWACAIVLPLLFACSMWAQGGPPGGGAQGGRAGQDRKLPPPPPPRGTDWSDWGSASNNANIAYRYRMLNNGKACFIEFKDQAQGNDYTSFDAYVEYQSVSPENEPVKKTDTLHLATTVGRNGTSQMNNCLGINDVNVNFVRRH